MKPLKVEIKTEIPEDKRLSVVDENGDEQIYEIVLTFHSDSLEKSYVLYKEPGDTDEVFAASFDEENNDGGILHPIETDEEWDMIEEVLETFTDDDESHEH